MNHARTILWLRVAIGAVCLLVFVGVAAFFWYGLADAYPAAVRNRYLEGLITLEEARLEIGDEEVAKWDAWTHERAKLKSELARNRD
jgi:hypothetical protein